MCARHRGHRPRWGQRWLLTLGRVQSPSRHHRCRHRGPSCRGGRGHLRCGPLVSWVYDLVARWRREGDAAFEPRSRRPKTSPAAIPAATVELIVQLRRRLCAAGLDAGSDTIGWHLAEHHRLRVSRATIDRTLRRQGLVVAAPKKRPRSSYIRFEAEQPNEMWQSDFTHYRSWITSPRDLNEVTAANS